jgi:hypothetical protein
MTASISSPLDVCNLALSQVSGRARVQSISPSDGTVAGDACALLYQPTVDAFSRAAHWNCLRFQTGPLGSKEPPPLQLLKAAVGTPEQIANPQLSPPPQPWLYEYLLPSDCLKARFLVPLFTQPSASPPLTTAGGLMLPAVAPSVSVPFQVAVDLDAQGNEQQVILTDLSQAQLVYTRRLANIALWDAQFVMGVKSALAVWLAPAVNGSITMANQAMAVAKAMLDAARMSDGNEGPQIQDHVPDWIRIREGGQGPRPHGLFVAPWDSFMFPNGISY